MVPMPPKDSNESRDRNQARRSFLKYSGLAAMASLAGCTGGGGGDGGGGDGGGGDGGGGDGGGGDGGGGDGSGGDGSGDLTDLEEAAQNESGQVSWYTSIPVAAGDQVINEFMSRYDGIVDGVDNVRSGSGEIVSRVNAERESDDLTVDCIHHTQAHTWAQWSKDGFLMELPDDVVNKEAYPEDLHHPKNHWGPARLFVHNWGLNTNQVDTDAIPDYDQGLNMDDIVTHAVENYAGEIGWGNYTGSTSVNNFLMHSLNHGDDQFWEWYEMVLETQPTLFNSGGDTISANVSGETSITHRNYNYRSNQVMQDGAPHEPRNPLDMEGNPGRPIQYVPAGIVKDSDVPNSSLLFTKFLLSSDGQKTIQNAYHGYSFHDPIPVERGENIPKFSEVFSPEWVILPERSYENEDKIAEIREKAQSINNQYM